MQATTFFSCFVAYGGSRENLLETKFILTDGNILLLRETLGPRLQVCLGVSSKTQNIHTLAR
jgi:hypothetical protein